MPRRTKAQALLTRENILDKAEREFQRRGVSRTTLEHIALAAGVTRGAIYWHFKNKADLFNAMMNRVALPLDQGLRRSAEASLADPVAQIREGFLAALKATAADPQSRRVFEIALFKVEHTRELHGVRERRLNGRRLRVADMEAGLRRATRRRTWTGVVPERHAAAGVHALLSGLISDWLLDPTAFDLQAVGRQMVDALLRGLQAHPASAPSPSDSARR